MEFMSETIKGIRLPVPVPEPPQHPTMVSLASLGVYDCARCGHSAIAPGSPTAFVEAKTRPCDQCTMNRLQAD